MKLGYSSATAGIYNIEKAFAIAEELSLDFIELTYEMSHFLPLVQDAKLVNELKRQTGIELSLHLPFVDLNIASLIPAVRRATVDETLRALEYAENIGAMTAVLHTGSFFLYQPVGQERSLNALRESLAMLAGSSPIIALENLAVFADSVIKGPRQLKEITNEFNFSNCLDMGHAFIEEKHIWTEQSDDLISDYINVLADDITHLHLCNNDGQVDMHSATNNGSIDFSLYKDFLSDFDGGICLEVAGGKESVRQSAEQLRSFETVLV